MILVLISLTFGAYANGGGEGEKGKDGEIHIGFTYHSSSDVFQTILKEAFEEYAATKKGVKITVIDPQYDIQKQNEAIENFITLGVDVIVMSPLEANGNLPALRAAQEAGIPLVAMNSEIEVKDDEPGYWYVGSNNYDSGILEGEYMAKVLPQGAKIVYLRGIEGMEHTLARRKGIQDALLDKRPDVVLLAEQTANYDRLEGLQVMEDWIQAYPEIDGVIAANDQMALGALEALKAAGIEGVMIAGIDGTTEAKQNVKNGTFAVTVLQDAPAQARGSLDVALKLVKGEKVPQRTIIPFVNIDKDNVDEFM